METSAPPAQYGFHSNATVNAVTKAGTNEWHGDLFEFLRNGDLNARDYFALARDPLKRNQWGGTVGGPIRKDKLFFFAGFQGTIQKSSPPQTIAYVPTPAMLAGNHHHRLTRLQRREANHAPGKPWIREQPNLSWEIRSGGTEDPTARLPVTSDPCGKTTFGLLSNQNREPRRGARRLSPKERDKHTLFGEIPELYVADLYIPSTYDGKDALTVSTNAA